MRREAERPKMTQNNPPKIAETKENWTGKASNGLLHGKLEAKNARCLNDPLRKCQYSWSEWTVAGGRGRIKEGVV